MGGGGGGGANGTQPKVSPPSSSSFVHHRRAATHVRCSGGDDVAPTHETHVDTDALIASYLSDAQVGQVRTFAATLLEWNKNMNLTGASTIDEVLQRHVADSLALIPAIEAALSTTTTATAAADTPAATEVNTSTSTSTGVSSIIGGGGIGGGTGTSTSKKPPVRILDVGSGAGFPGVALAIARPHWEVTLLDTLQKRTSFLDAAAAACGAGNVRTLWSRAEDAGKRGSEHRESYDVVTARAVAELRVLAELCVPLVAVGGAFVAAKNSRASTAEEVAAAANAVETLGGGALTPEEVLSVGPDGLRRTAVISRKLRPTPDKYPRRAGLPNKRPL